MAELTPDQLAAVRDAYDQSSSFSGFVRALSALDVYDPSDRLRLVQVFLLEFGVPIRISKSLDSWQAGRMTDTELDEMVAASMRETGAPRASPGWTSSASSGGDAQG